MLKTKLFFKGIIKYPTSLALNVLSLTIAFTGIITLILYISYEKNYDTYNENYDNTYKIIIGKEGFTVPAKIAPIIKENISKIESITPFWFVNKSITTKELKQQKINYYEHGLFANNDLFEIFTFPLILGNKQNVLTEKNTVVISEMMRDKLFKIENPIGKEVLIGDNVFKVTGVMKDIPQTSSFRVDYVSSFITINSKPDDFPNLWSEWSFQVFCKINGKANKQSLEKKINSIKEFIDHFSKYEDKETDRNFHLQPLSLLHFTPNGNFDNVSKKLLNILLVLALILFVMGIVNFINLTTAQVIQKSKNISIKRVMGSTKSSVLFQIITESILISIVSILLSFILHRLLYPYLEETLNIQGLTFNNRANYYLYFIVFAVIFGIISAIYPALYLTSNQLSKSIRGIQKFSFKGQAIKNGLLIIQFILAFVLIIASIGIRKQIKYWQNYDVGIEKENILYIRTTKDIQLHYQAFADELIKNENITDYTYSNFIPGGVGMGWGRTIDDQSVSFMCWPVDENFLNFYNVEIVKGRTFSKDMKTDKGSFVFNQAAIDKFNWDKPLGKKIPAFSDDGTLIGVSRNFNFSSLKDNIQPMAFWLFDGRRNELSLKLKPNKIPEAISFIKDTWEKFEPAHDFNYSFLDDYLDRLYKKEEQISQFIGFVSLWSIILALTGLLGLVIFTARNKTKEIGIRKVNGATISDIVLMLNQSFLKWVILAFIFAIPLSYYALSKWLENFAYKTSISWWIFALAGIIVLFITLITISLYTFKVARRNPIEALRYE